MTLTVEQKLALDQLIAENEEWSLEYGFSFITVDDLHEKVFPGLLKIIGDSSVQSQ